MLNQACLTQTCRLAFSVMSCNVLANFYSTYRVCNVIHNYCCLRSPVIHRSKTVISCRKVKDFSVQLVILEVTLKNGLTAKELVHALLMRRVNNTYNTSSYNSDSNQWINIILKCKYKFWEGYFLGQQYPRFRIWQLYHQSTQSELRMQLKITR